MEKTTIIRLGHYLDDPIFLDHIRTIYAHFTKRLAYFTAFDANFGGTFSAGWQTAINDFEAHPTDEMMLDLIEYFTDAIAAQKKVCLTAINDVEYYTKRAFPDNKSKLREFGFTKTRNEANRGDLKMVAGLIVMFNITNSYNTELTAAGMPPSVPLNIQTQWGLLAQKEVQQEIERRNRIRVLEQRITKYNTLYGFYKRVNQAAKVIYHNNPETRQLFEMLHGVKILEKKGAV